MSELMDMNPQNPPNPRPQTQPSLSSKPRKKIPVALKFIAVVIGIFILAIIAIPTTLYLSFGLPCNQRSDRLQAAVDTLEHKLEAVSVNGSIPDSVSVWKDGDCLTGHGAVGTASFYNFSYPNIATANAQLHATLRSPSSSSNPEYTLGDYEGDYLAEYIQTNVRSGIDNMIYEAKYYLTSHVSCPDLDYESSVCVQGEPMGGAQRYMNVPVYKVELEARQAVID